MIENTQPLLRERDIKKFSELTLLNMGECYKRLRPGKGADDFIRDILNIVGNLDDPAIEGPLEIIAQFISDSDRERGPEWLANSPIGSVIVSCTFCLRAMRAASSGLESLAWSYTADAMFWSGVSISNKGVGEAMSLRVAAVRKEAKQDASIDRAKSGAEGKDMLLEPARQFAYQLARRPGANWKTKSHAASVLMKQIRTYMKENHIPHKEDADDANVVRTIAGWFGKMPDASSIFPPSKKRAGIR